jgi:DNA repair protein RadC
MNNKLQKWQHPGGKLRELGAETLTDAELLSILDPRLRQHLLHQLWQEVTK